MSKQKIEKEFVYKKLGFPIVLTSVPMIEIRGVSTLDLNLNMFQKMVLLALAHSPTDLTGNQIRFIRTWFRQTQAEFGKLFGLTHPAVVKWEKTGNRASKINLTTQREMRMLILDKLLTRDDDFRKAFRTMHVTEFSGKPHPLEFDVPTDLVAI